MATEPPSPDYLPEEYLKSFTEKYNLYQRRYVEEPRESDKVLISLIAGVVSVRSESGERISLLDIGCSTGNLLFHIKHALPELELVGGDLAPNAIAACRADSRLAGIQFHLMDIFDLPDERFDVIVANAATYFLDNEQYGLAASSVVKALKPGGCFLSFEFLHPFEQDLRIVEVSRSHPDGIKLHFRPFSFAGKTLEKHGFERISFRPFCVPIDLKKGTRYTDDQTGAEDLNSYTIRAESGERMVFRGVLCQPWCHLVAYKKDR